LLAFEGITVALRVNVPLMGTLASSGSVFMLTFETGMGSVGPGSIGSVGITGVASLHDAMARKHANARITAKITMVFFHKTTSMNLTISYLAVGEPVLKYML